MRDDEFTNSKSNNESFIAKSEFGNLPDSEFSDSGEMHMHKAAYDPSLMKSNSNSGNTKTVEDVTQSSSTAVESTVAGSGAATSIAATSAGVLTVASTVAIGALSVFAVISNMTHDYQVILDSVRVIDDSMTYLVSVYDRNMSEKDYDDYFRERYKDADQGASMSEEEMEYPFVVKLYNASYSSSMHADYLSNEGVFQHITIGDTYTIEVSEDKFGGEVLYENTFIASYSYSFDEFLFPVNVDLENGTFEAYLDFYDDADAYSEFSLYIYDLDAPEQINYTFDLQKEAGYQTIIGPNSQQQRLDLSKDWGYRFTFKEKDELVVFKEGTAHFEDMYGRESKFNSFIFEKTANFLESTFEVQLDYVDDFNYYDNFTLTLLPNGVNAQYDFHLDPTTEVQTCTFDAQQHWNYSFDYEYSYSLTCAYQGAIRTLDSGENFKFTDNSGFLGLDFDETYDYGTNDFSLKLNYEDPDNNFSNFVFHLTYEDDPSEPSIDISLEKTTEVQSFDLDDYDLYTGTWYMYNLTCDYKGNAVTLVTSEESFQFSDPDLVPSGSITFVNNEMNYHDGTMKVQFDYTDKYNMISSAWLVFYGKNSEDQDDYINESSEIYLEVTKEVQEINIADINTGEEDGINFTKYNLAYDLYYEYYTDTDTDISSLYGSPHPITLTNSAVTAVNGYQSKFQVFEEMDATQGYAQTYMYIYFDAVDENDMWSSYKAYWEGVNPANGSTFVQADIQFNERELGGWHKANITCAGASDDIFNGEGWDLVVIADVNNPYTDYSAVDEEIYRIKDTKPVYVSAPDPEIFDIGFSDSAMPAGDNNYSLTAFPLFAGDESQYTDVEFIFEKEDGSTYTYQIDTFSDYFDFYIDIPSEGAIDVWNDFENVKFTISVRYCTLINNVKSNPITKVLETNKSFYISV